MKLIFITLIFVSLIYGDYIDDFNTFKPILTDSSVETKNHQNKLSGKLNVQSIYNYNDDKMASVKKSIFLDYTNVTKQNLKFKINGKYYYDVIYDIKDNFSDQEKNEFRHELELNEAYVDGKIKKNLDFKLGRQVVAWGTSDNIRVVDIINPLDNRRPGLTDIENLRLPVNILKFDYFRNDWNISPLLILEQRFSKIPPLGSPFYPMNFEPNQEKYNDTTYGLKVSKNFHRGGVNLYTARIYDDEGYMILYPTALTKHEKINMLGSSENFTWGSWLFKNENAYFDGAKYTSVNNKNFNRFDTLLGFEYFGYSDMTISYDSALRTIVNYNPQLTNEINPLYEKTYQNALRISKNFIHNTLNLNYLLSTQGNKIFTKVGGLERFWVEYKVTDAVKLELGIVDYIGGSNFYDNIKDQDSTYFDVSYNF